MVSLDRRTVVMGAFVALLLSINVLYGMIEIAFVSESIGTQAFVIASASWIIGYAYCEGDTWDSATSVGKGLMATSWVLLIGMEFTEVIPDLIASNGPWAGATAVLVHVTSFYMSSLK